MRVSSDMISMKLLSIFKYQVDTIGVVNCDSDSERDAFLYRDRLPFVSTGGVSRHQLIDMQFLVAIRLSNLELRRRGAVYRFPNELSSPVDVTFDHTAHAQI